MSHTIVRGEPVPAQLFVDKILAEILAARSKPFTLHNIETVNFAQILFHCLKKNPESVFMINCHTGEVITNSQILQDAVSLARALIAKGVRGKTVTLLMRNHQRATAMYLAVLFAQTLPFMQDPMTTTYFRVRSTATCIQQDPAFLIKLYMNDTNANFTYFKVEITHFLKLIEPSFIFCDEEHRELVETALAGLPHIQAEMVVMETEVQMQEFAKGCSRDVESFVIPDRDPISSVMMLPTSGSTGLPKAALMSGQGLIAQLAGPWMYYKDFPKPTELVMICTTIQWMTFIMYLASSITFEVPLLLSPKPSTAAVLTDMLLKYRPTLSFFSPAVMATLLPEVTPEHLSSLKKVTLLGAPSSMDLLAATMDKLPKDAHLCDGYGTTETQGYMAIPDRETPLKSNGRVFNIMNYKLLDSDGNKVGLCQSGELYVKGSCCSKGYYKNQKAYTESFENGWFKTGDQFYIDENERLFYLQRIKFSFKILGCHVSPEEVEAVIGSVDGVLNSCACATDAGVAALVATVPGREVTAKQIHMAVDANLSEHKRLHGGIVFVPSLPLTPNGKLKRNECKAILLNHIKNATA